MNDFNYCEFVREVKINYRFDEPIKDVFLSHEAAVTQLTLFILF